MSTDIIIYTKANCHYCDKAKSLLSNKGLTYREIRVDLEPDQLAEMIKRSQRRTMPQIFINDQPVGGFDDLAKLNQSGQLDEMIALPKL